jgi:hypothetical protein
VLLSRPYPLFDVDDIEAFTAGIVRRSGLDLSNTEHEELHVFLIEEAWILSLRYHAGGVTFSSFAGTTLRLRCIDWVRRHRGRTRWRPAPAPTNANGHSSSVSTTSIPTTITWEKLSETAAWTMTHIAFPISLGLSTSEVARRDELLGDEAA